MSPSFNLIDEPFVPCLRGGGVTEYGLRDVLLNAHEIAELRDASPLVTVALHRLLLAILHRVYRGPKNAAERVAIRTADRFDTARITAYFDQWKDRFDLFGAKYPFYQLAGFKTKEPSGVNRLAQELARGNNAALFDHTTDDPPPTLTPAQAARLVIAEQGFAVGGGKSDTGNTTSAPMVGGAVVLARGDALFETLWLNLTVFTGKHPVASLEKDAPVWERPPEEPHRQPANPKGYLDYMTWQSRTLCLHPEEEGGKVAVRRVSYAQGRKLEVGKGFYDPMMAYFRSDKDGDRPVRFNEYRDLWRDSAALFQFGEHAQSHRPTVLHTLSAGELGDVLPPTAKYTLSVFGLCTDKAKVNFWRHESLPLPPAYLDKSELVESLKRALALAEEVAGALRGAVRATAKNLLRSEASGEPDKDRVTQLCDSFAADVHYWSRLELPFRKLLTDLAGTNSPEERSVRVAEWFDDDLARLAWDAFNRAVGTLTGGQRTYSALFDSDHRHPGGETVMHRGLAGIRKAEQWPDKQPQPKDGAK